MDVFILVILACSGHDSEHPLDGSKSVSSNERSAHAQFSSRVFLLDKMSGLALIFFFLHL